MSEPFIAEIRIFAGNFAPRNWAFCDGQLLPIAQNTALFSLIGTIYGGDGRTTTALPNLKDRAPMHSGSGPGLTPRSQGQHGGNSAQTLTEAEMAPHTHSMPGSTDPGNKGEISSSSRYAVSPLGDEQYATTSLPKAMAAGAIQQTGSGQAHNNMPPYLALNFIIALTGTYPSRS